MHPTTGSSASRGRLLNCWSKSRANDRLKSSVNGLVCRMRHPCLFTVRNGRVGKVLRVWGMGIASATRSFKWFSGMKGLSRIDRCSGRQGEPCPRRSESELRRAPCRLIRTARFVGQIRVGRSGTSVCEIGCCKSYSHWSAHALFPPVSRKTGSSEADSGDHQSYRFHSAQSDRTARQ